MLGIIIEESHIGRLELTVADSILDCKVCNLLLKCGSFRQKRDALCGFCCSIAERHFGPDDAIVSIAHGVGPGMLRLLCHRVDRIHCSLTRHGIENSKFQASAIAETICHNDVTCRCVWIVSSVGLSGENHRMTGGYGVHNALGICNGRAVHAESGSSLCKETGVGSTIGDITVT